MEFWCPVCKDKRSVPYLQVASKDGTTLYKVCESHFPEGHGRDAVAMVESHPNADGTVRTISFEDLLTQLSEPKVAEPAA